MAAPRLFIHNCLPLAVLGSLACSTQVIPDATANYTVAVGAQVTIRLGTIGPGPIFDTVPTLSSSAVGFVAETPDSVATPGGPAQLFTFVARAPGRAVVTFRRTGTTDIVDEIIDVQ